MTMYSLSEETLRKLLEAVKQNTEDWHFKFYKDRKDAIHPDAFITAQLAALEKVDGGKGKGETAAEAIQRYYDYGVRWGFDNMRLASIAHCKALAKRLPSPAMPEGMKCPHCGAPIKDPSYGFMKFHDPDECKLAKE